MSQDPAAAAGRTPAPTPGPLAARAREAVAAALAACDAALAGWEAGSAAFGRADLASDLDVGVLCIRGGGRHVLDAIEHHLRELGDELDAWDVGRSAFGVQRFWRPVASVADPSWCVVDASVIELERERDEWRELLQPERHGRALPLHDPDGVLERCRSQAHFDSDAHRDRIRTELARIRGRRALLFDIPAKEFARGRALDAQLMHRSLVVAPLVALLGMRHRPLRFDFARYLHDELPAAVVERLTPIANPETADLLRAIDDGLAWIDELLGAIDADALPIDEHAAQVRAAFG